MQIVWRMESKSGTCRSTISSHRTAETPFGGVKESRDRPRGRHRGAPALYGGEERVTQDAVERMMQDNAPRHRDGSAGDANYGAIGQGYANFRRPDPRIAEMIDAALGEAGTVLNVGAGAGSYEPVGRTVTPGRTVAIDAGTTAVASARRDRCGRGKAAVRGRDVRCGDVDLLGASMEEPDRRPARDATGHARTDRNHDLRSRRARSLLAQRLLP